MLASGLNEGFDISRATVPQSSGTMAMSNAMADRDEDFNTRYGSYKGWQLAIQRVKPVPRHTASPDLVSMARQAGVDSAAEVVDWLSARFLRLPMDAVYRDKVIEELEGELGASRLSIAENYLEEPLRIATHLIMSSPEYQVN